MFLSGSRSKTFSAVALAAYAFVASLQVCHGQASVNSPTPMSTASNSPTAPVTPTVHAEHWNQLRLSQGDLVASPPLIGETGTFAGFTREFLRLQWRGGDPIEIYVMRPIGVKNPPVVLYLYGYPSDSDRFRNAELCKNLTRNGFAAVGFTSALTGQRYHNRPMKQWFVSELQESLGASVHDVQMILNYLTTRGDLDMNRVGMFGQGSGGTIALLAAAVDPQIKAVDVMDPWGDWPDWVAKSPQIPDTERPDYLKPAFLAQVAPLDPVAWLPKLNDRPVRLQELLFNPASPEAARKKLEAALPANATSIEYRDKAEYIAEVSTNARMLDWIQAKLAQSGPSSVASSAPQNIGGAADTAQKGSAPSSVAAPPANQP